MSPTQSFTPDNVSIVKRNPKLDIAEALKTEWMDNHVFATAWLNAMSITFPLGEQFFINSVRHYRDRITDPKLQREMKAFTVRKRCIYVSINAITNYSVRSVVMIWNSLLAPCGGACSGWKKMYRRANVWRVLWQ